MIFILNSSKFTIKGIDTSTNEVELELIEGFDSIAIDPN